MLEAPQAHDKLLREHLAEEEDNVIPMLLSLTPAEFERYYRLPIGSLLRQMAEEN